jgi:hypothetical protein
MESSGMKLLWRLRRSFQKQLDAAPMEKRAGFRAAQRGVTQAIKRLEARAATDRVVANKLNELARLSIVSD